MEYIRTDDLQWARKNNEHSFDLVEVRNLTPDTYYFVAGNVDLHDYSDEYIDNCVISYGYKNKEDVKIRYKDDWAQVIAECLFEDTPGDELYGFGPYDTEEGAEKGALEYIKNQKVVDTNK